MEPIIIARSPRSPSFESQIVQYEAQLPWLEPNALALVKNQIQRLKLKIVERDMQEDIQEWKNRPDSLR
jgi:hypothetical protein